MHLNKKQCLMAAMLLATCLTLNLQHSLGSPAKSNNTDYHKLLKYERHFRIEETTTTRTSGAQSTNPTTAPESTGATHQSDSDLYTLQLGQHNHRQLKYNDVEVVFDYRCPKLHYIHPCYCEELDKRLEMIEGSGDALPDASSNSTPTVEIEEPLTQDQIETVAYCKNIRNEQVLTEAIRGFQGHRINFFVIDGCKLPHFPNDLFKGIHVVWMEILNSTLQFHDNFFHAKSCP